MDSGNATLDDLQLKPWLVLLTLSLLLDLIVLEPCPSIIDHLVD